MPEAVDYASIEDELVDSFPASVRLATRETGAERPDIRTGDEVTFTVALDRLLTGGELAFLEGLEWAEGRITAVSQEWKRLGEAREGASRFDQGDIGDAEITLGMVVPPLGRAASGAARLSTSGARVWRFLKSNLVKLGVAAGLIGYAVNPTETGQAVSTTVNATGDLVTRLGSAASSILMWVLLVILALIILEVVRAFK